MKKHLPILLLSIFILGAVFSSAIAGATDNPAVNETASKILKTNKSINKAANQTVNKSANQTVNETVSLNETCPVNLTEIETGIPVAEQKFRMGPTVVLRPVNDVITKNEDGLVELYIDNPSLNDVTLNVDARISVPAGIHVYGQGFAQTGAAGTVYGIFSVPPGNARTIYIDIKGEKVGSSTVHFTGLYWPGDNKDDYSPISLSHPFTVEEPSKNLKETSDLEENSGVEAKGQGSFSTPGFGIIIAGMGLLGVYIVRRR